MDVVWNSTSSILPHDRIGLSFIDNDGQRATSHYFRTAYDPASVKLGADYSAGLANSSLRDILDKGTARIIHDLDRYLELNPDSTSTRLLIDEGISSNLTLPLKVDDRAVGFLFFSSKAADVFTEIHARILLEVSDIMSQHIEKVWRIKKLEEARQDYLSMLGFVSHEMKSPLSSMMSVGSVYAKGYMGAVDPLAEKTVNKMMRISGYLINMVNNYLDLSRLESGEMNFNPGPGVDFRKDILEFAIDTVSAHADERGSKIIVASPTADILLTGDIDLLRIVAVNLLDNAVKYGDEHIDINVTLEQENNNLVFSVRNKGVGFDKEQAKMLFRRFSRLRQKGTEDRRGSGLGLYLTWWIVQKHNGRITADSEPGQWAEFTVYLNLNTDTDPVAQRNLNG
jgi:signal transduction histidine kinase